MKAITYTPLKVNNEIALCEVTLISQKEKIQRALLKHHISYFAKWSHPGFFKKSRETCTIYVNLNDLDTAREAIEALGSDFTSQIRFLKIELPKQYY